ncbi:hypothetical protein CYMTET_32875 [Cymbomonas tetramitiformis]|uniref:Peroxisomal ATPase PEX1 N-terminal C-lobe domain-containing protein n=1 Tax=Cymbomonas tetramitiformis TaxID=36881 RepID=A0AAE0KRE8_9CHLO|nr:hypothetical protein CYMTET_32875 [Cymbomonas tetramitiformis]
MELAESVLGSRHVGKELVVRLVHETSCFVALPAALLQHLYDSIPVLPLALEMNVLNDDSAVAEQTDPRLIAWAGAASSGPHMEVPAAFAECINLLEGQRVNVRIQNKIPAATMVEVEPAGHDDWEMIELNAEYMESQMLNQVGVLYVGQVFPFWAGLDFLSLCGATIKSLLERLAMLEPPWRLDRCDEPPLRRASCNEPRDDAPDATRCPDDTHEMQ